MPEGHPAADKLWSGDISFFSIDTNLIQSAGYRFESGVLGQLPNQLPETMELQLPEIVLSEIVNHKMSSVLDAIKQLQGASEKLRRLAGIDTDQLDGLFEGLSVERVAYERFTKEVMDYVKRCGGAVLRLAGSDLAEKIFNLYFSTTPPFGASGQKKSEFPDAACLILLEDYAREYNTKGIVASDDGGWKQFASTSEYIYCVGSIDELTNLFAATGELAASVKERVAAAINDAGSPLRAALQAALEQHVENSPWFVDEIQTVFNGRAEGEVVEAVLQSYELDGNSISAWSVQGAPSSWVIELTATVKANVTVDIARYIWDSIDRDEVRLGTESIDKYVEIQVEAFLQCDGVTPGDEPSDWKIEVDCQYHEYAVDVGEVELFYD